MSVSVVCALFTPATVQATAGINKQINFQGRLLNSSGATVPDGYYNIQFKIYQDGDGQSVGNTTGSPSGTLKWTEEHLNNNSQGVQVKNGFMSVQLGSVTTFGTSVDWNQDTLWLSMNIGSTNTTCTPFSSCTPDGEMVPMKRLSSTPYALNSGQLGGLSSAQFVQLAQGVQTDATNGTPSIYINKTGTGNLLEFQTGGSGAFLLTNSGDATFGANANHTLSVATAGAGVAGKTLTVVAGGAGTGAAVNGGDLLLQGGAASGTGTTGSVIVKSNTANSSAAFQVQNAAGTAAVIVDTANNTLKVAGAIDTTTATTLTVGGSTATTVQIGNTSLSSGTQAINIGTNNTSGGTTNITIGAGGSATAGFTAIQAKDNITFSTNGTTRATFDTANSLFLGNGTTAATPNNFTISGTGSSTTGVAGASLTLRAGNATTGNANGGIAYIYGGTKSGTGTDGNVVLAHNGSSAIGYVGIGTAAPSRELHVSTSNTSTTANQLLIEQLGTGDTGLEVKTITNSYYVGADNSDGSKFKISSSSAAGSTSQFGSSSVGGSTDSGDVNFQNSTKFTSGSAGTLTSISVYIDGGSSSNQFSVAIYADNGGSPSRPGSLIASSSNTNIAANNWNTVAVSASLSATTTYWLAFNTNDAGANMKYNTGSSNTSCFIARTFSSGWTNPFGAGCTLGAQTFSIYANYTVSGVSDHFSTSLFSMGATGDTIFMNSSNSTGAFRIMSASSAQTVLTADTTNNTIKIGDSTGTDTATTIFMLDSTTTAPTTSLASKNGGLYYDSSTNGIRAIVNGSVVEVCTSGATCSGYGTSSGFIQLQASSPGTAQTGHFNITGTGILTQLQTEDKSAASTNTSNLTIRTGNAAGTTSNSGSLTIDVGTATGTAGSITIGRNGVVTTLPGTTKVGSSTTDSTQVNLQLDSYNGTSDSGTCSTTVNQGAMYYNSSMGSLRACLNGSWSDVSNPDTLGLLTFGIVPSTGANPYDLPALVTAGVTGPCKVSWASATSVSISACVAYSNGRRVNVATTTLNTNSATTNNTSLTTTNRWGHICLSGANDQPAFTNTAGVAAATSSMPTFNISAPILCLADVLGSNTTAGNIAQIYDVRTFTSTVKEAVNMATASELGMLVDSSGTGGLAPSATCTTGTCSGKLYGVVVATDGTTSAGTPNSIVAAVGPAYVKATAGTAGQFIKSGPTAGYAETVAAIPNNAFYYSPGNTRTSFASTCSSAANCLGSLYVNFIVR